MAVFERRHFVAHFVALATLIAALWVGPRVHVSSGEALPARLSDRAFWKMIGDFSEPGGYFRSDNLISNESTYLVSPAFIRIKQWIDEGKIGKIVVPEGSDGVKVGTVIAMLEGEGDETGAASEPASSPAEAEKAEESAPPVIAPPQGQAEEGAAAGQVAEQAGRGRPGRAWVRPGGRGSPRWRWAPTARS